MKVKDGEISELCRNCTKMESCLKESKLKALLMTRTTYCTKFDNRDKTLRPSPFKQPYEAEIEEAVRAYQNQRKQYSQF